MAQRFLPVADGRCLRRAVLRLALAVAILPLPGFPAMADEVLWEALRGGGHVALLRHALAPGTGDPAQFALGDCTTQRNLSAEGRRQAVRIGQRLRRNGIPAARVYTSQWCRCRDTAALLALGPAQDLPVLNSFFRQTERRQPQTDGLRDWIGRQTPGQPIILVTHQVNITALTGVYPASGELVVLRVPAQGAVTVRGTVRTD